MPPASYRKGSPSISPKLQTYKSSSLHNTYIWTANGDLSLHLSIILPCFSPPRVFIVFPISTKDRDSPILINPRAQTLKLPLMPYFFLIHHIQSLRKSGLPSQNIQNSITPHQLHYTTAKAATISHENHHKNLLRDLSQLHLLVFNC